MLPVLIWGVIIFGIRTLETLIASVLAVTAMHLLLKRVLRWRRGFTLVYPHCLVSALVLVSLAHPVWPIWIVIAMALLVPIVLAALLGGPGKEPVHVAVVLVFVLQFAVLPALPRLNTYAACGPDAVLAKDRLLVGDIRDQRSGSIDPWPNSLSLGAMMPCATPTDCRWPRGSLRCHLAAHGKTMAGGGTGGSHASRSGRARHSPGGR